MIRLAAIQIVRLAALLMPAELRDWGAGMRAEVGLIDGRAAALVFALGCLGCALREAAIVHLLQSPPVSMAAGPDTPPRLEILPMPIWNSLASRPRILAACCAVGAAGLGLAYMAAAGAPTSFLAMNGAALVLGLFLAAMLAKVGRPGEAARGVVGLALASALLLTALLGISADGVTRWISAGGILVQPSSILLPILVLGVARSPGVMSTASVLIAALALALQPDRAMAGALAAAMTALALARRGRSVLLAFGGAFAALTVTMVRQDASPAVPFVDQIFFTSFAVHPLAGIAVLAGALLLIVPAIVGGIQDPGNRATYAVFGATWTAILVAAALGNYPTPLVGYGGSAILGYLIGLLGLPPHSAPATIGQNDGVAREEAEHRNRHLRVELS